MVKDILFPLTAFLMIACVGNTPSTMGKVNGPCYENGTCDTGLECNGDVCIELDVDKITDDGEQQDKEVYIPDDQGEQQYQVAIADKGRTNDFVTSDPNGNGQTIVFDSVTGLTWGPVSYSQTYTWQGALDYCENLNYAGFEDWHLPTPHELLSLVDYSAYGLAVYDSVESAFSSNKFWTSIRYDNEKVWTVGFGYGDLYANATSYDLSDGEQFSTFGTICVHRSETGSFQGERYVYKTGGVVRDNLTMLDWMSGTYSDDVSWGTARNDCTNAEYAEKTDWRLPGVNELRSLLDFRKKSPATNAPIVNAYTGPLWSGKLFAEDGYQAWLVDFENGGITSFDPSLRGYSAICVRNSDPEEEDIDVVSDQDTVQPDISDVDIPDIGGSDEDADIDSIIVSPERTDILVDAVEGAWIRSMAMDHAGNLILVGQVPPPGYQSDILVMKLGPSGDKIWEQSWGTDVDDVAYAVALDVADNIYITGSSQGDLDGNVSNGGTCGVEPVTFPCTDVFLSKISPDGVKIWTRLYGTVNGDFGQGVALDSQGDIYVVGFTDGTFENNTTAGQRDIFVSKWGPDGTFLFTQQIGTPMTDVAYAVAVDPSDNIYFTGYAQGDLNNNTMANDASAFLVKMDTTGNYSWKKQWKGMNQPAFAYAISIDTAGDVLVAGQVGATTYSDPLLIKWSPEGVIVWSDIWGSTSEDRINAVVTNKENEVYVTGFTLGHFDGETSAGGKDSFVSKMSVDNTLFWNAQWGTSNTDFGTGITIDSNNMVYVSSCQNYELYLSTFPAD